MSKLKEQLEGQVKQLDVPTKEQWLKPEVVFTIEGKIAFIAPVAQNDTQSVTIELPDNSTSSNEFAELFDCAKDCGYTQNELPYGVSKQGLRRIQVRMSKVLLQNAKTGYNIVVPIEFTIEGKTTYWDKESDSAKFHEKSALRTGAPTITSRATEADEEQEEKQLQRIEAQTTDGKAMAVATFYGNRR